MQPKLCFLRSVYSLTIAYLPDSQLKIQRKKCETVAPLSLQCNPIKRRRRKTMRRSGGECG